MRAAAKMIASATNRSRGQTSLLCCCRCWKVEEEGSSNYEFVRWCKQNTWYVLGSWNPLGRPPVLFVFSLRCAVYSEGFDIVSGALRSLYSDGKRQQSSETVSTAGHIASPDRLRRHRRVSCGQRQIWGGATSVVSSQRGDLTSVYAVRMVSFIGMWCCLAVLSMDTMFFRVWRRQPNYPPTSSFSERYMS